MPDIGEPVVAASLFNEVSQWAHAAGGAAAIFGSVVLFGEHSKWWAFGLVAALAAVKEFYYDQKCENEVVRGSNWEDFAFYMLGAGIAFALSAFAEIL